MPYPVEEEDRWGRGARPKGTWDPPGRLMTGLALKTQQKIVFKVETERLHVLFVNAEWDGLGSVDYGLLPEI